MKLLYVTLLTCVLLTACGSTANTASSPEPKEEFKPTLEVDHEISGNQVNLIIDTDLKISKEHYGQARKTGEGHIHLYLDNGPKIGVKEKKTFVPDLDPGKHKLRISLHNNDHTPYDVWKTIEFEIE